MTELSNEQVASLKRAFAETKAEIDSFLQNHFDNTFVHTGVYQDIQVQGKTLLIGRKGAGKSATLYAFKKENSENYLCTHTIELDDLPFTALYNFFYRGYQDTLRKIQKKAEVKDFIELEKIASYAWRNAILGMSVLVAANTIKNDEQLWEILSEEYRADIDNIIQVINKFSGIDNKAHADDSYVFGMLLMLFVGFQELIEKVLDANLPSMGLLLAKLTADFISKLKKNFDETLKDASLKIQKVLSALGNKRVFIGVDKFDDYYDDFYDELKSNSTKSDQDIPERKHLLNALLEGIVLVARDFKSFPELSWVDAFFAIPMDKFLELHLRERADLESRRVTFVQWAPKELFAFVNKRICEALNKSYSEDGTEWYEIFGSTVSNSATKQPEDTFLYVVRHSLWKPRELQIHIRVLLENIEKKKRKLTKEEFRDSIKSSSAEIIRQQFLAEFIKEYPYISDIIKQLENSTITSVMDYSDVCDVISGHKLSDSLIRVDQVMLRLYKMGVIGVRVKKHSNHRETVTQQRENIQYKFHFNCLDVNPLSSASKIVFHPMFFEYIAAKHEQSYIINELKWDMYE